MIRRQYPSVSIYTSSANDRTAVFIGVEPQRLGIWAHDRGPAFGLTGPGLWVLAIIVVGEPISTLLGPYFGQFAYSINFLGLLSRHFKSVYKFTKRTF